MTVEQKGLKTKDDYDTKLLFSLFKLGGKAAQAEQPCKCWWEPGWEPFSQNLNESNAHKENI